MPGEGGGGAGSWHEPVSGARSDSPGGGAGGGAQYPGQGAGPGQNMYSCKMQGPPSPQETKVSSLPSLESSSLILMIDGGRRLPRLHAELHPELE